MTLHSEIIEFHRTADEAHLIVARQLRLVSVWTEQRQIDSYLVQTSRQASFFVGRVDDRVIEATQNLVGKTLE